MFETCLALSAMALVVPVTVLLRGYGLKKSSVSVAQGLLVLMGAILSAAAYVFLRRELGEGLLLSDKFWCVLPLSASLIVTGRCGVQRVLKSMFEKRRGSNGNN